MSHFSTESQSVTKVPVETLWQRIWRHLKRKEVDPHTVQRGARYIRLLVESILLGQVSIVPSNVERDFLNYRGCDVFHYGFSSTNLEMLRSDMIQIIEFPLEAEVQIIGSSSRDDNNNQDWWQAPEKYFSVLAGAYATFLGPTRHSPWDFPNNGFYSQHTGLKIPFGTNNSSIGRRGAIAMPDSGEFEILTDAQRQVVIDNNFADYRVVAGTSFYFSSEDSGQDIDSLSQPGKAIFSYIILYKDKNNLDRIAHISASMMLSRHQMKFAIDAHAHNQRWRSYIAAELDYSEDACIFLDSAKRRSQNMFYRGGATSVSYIQVTPDRYLIRNKTDK